MGDTFFFVLFCIYHKKANIFMAKRKNNLAFKKQTDLRMVVLEVDVFPRSFWASVPTNGSSLAGVLPSTALVNQHAGTHSPPGVSFPQPLSQDIAGLLPLFGQTLVGVE